MTRYRFRLPVLLFGALAITVSGCGRAEFTFVPVEGTVTKGGRPLRGMEVVFIADLDAGTVGPKAIGRTDEAGHYRLRTERGDDGAVVGKHRVLVIDAEDADKRMLQRFRGKLPKGAERLSPEAVKSLQDQLKTSEEAPRVPPSYGRFNETPLRAEVGHESPVFDIVIP
jgi:hypothetical protein